MTTLDIVLRSMAGTQLLFLACLLLLRSRDEVALRYAALLPAGLATFMATSAPLPAGALGELGLPLTIVCVANPAWFWMFSKAWFDDDFRPGLREAGVVIAMVVLGLAHEVGAGGAPSMPLDVAFKAAILAFVALAVVNVVRGRRADLDEGRRRGRVTFVAAIFLYAIVAIALQIAYDGRLPVTVVRANVALLLVVAFALSAWLALRWRRPVVAGEQPPPRASLPASAPASIGLPVVRAIPATDPALVARVRHAMEVEHLYRREALTVAALATALGSQEYRVRRAINQGLGYRNFNEFLHRYRLDEASARLRTQSHLPILTIALDVGFGSIGPFNRAFRARFGCTPTEYRNGAPAGVAASDRAPAGSVEDHAPAPGVAAI